MALRSGRLIQDQNLNVHYNGDVGGQKKVSKAPKKGGGAVGRKPLADLSSNSMNSLPNQALKKQNTNVSCIGDKKRTTTFGANKKKSISTASEKVQTGGARKALSDISNSIKMPCVPHQDEAKKNPNAKQSVVVEEECFLHDHQKCIKAHQKCSMHMNEFLQMVGLDKDLSGQSSLLRTPLMSNKTKIWEPLEMSELLIEEDQSLRRKLASPFATRTPEPDNRLEHWTDYDCVSYRLIETPYLPKHYFNSP